MPINNSLIRNTVLVVQNLHAPQQRSAIGRERGDRGTDFENLRECLDDARVFITIHLDRVDEGNLGLGAVAERF